jgi:hypothetical protein
MRSSRKTRSLLLRQVVLGLIGVGISLVRTSTGSGAQPEVDEGRFSIIFVSTDRADFNQLEQRTLKM